MATSFKDFLKVIEQEGKNPELVIVEALDGELFECNAVRVFETDVDPDFDELLKHGWWGGQTRMVDGDPETDLCPAYNDDGEYIGIKLSLVLGRQVMVDESNYFFWRVESMPDGFAERHKGEEIEW